MAIISIVPGQTGLVGVLPSIAYIETNDPLATVMNTGYLNHDVQLGLQFSLPCMAEVSTQETPTSPIRVGWFQVVHVSTNWSLIPINGSSNPGTINQLAYYAATGNVVSGIGPLTNGQLLIGSTGLPPVAANISGTGGVSVLNTAGGIQISGTGGGIGWVNATGPSQQMANNTAYVADNAGLLTFTLPLVAGFGTVIGVVGLGAGGWKIAQNAGQNIQVGMTSTTVGVGGSVASSNFSDTIDLVCVVPNTTWTLVGAPQGILSIV